MNLLRRIWVAARDYFNPQEASPASAAEYASASPAPSSEESIAQAASDCLRVPHASYERILFRHVNAQGELVKNSEEWQRNGNEVRTVMTATRVITQDKEIISPERIGGICGVCHGYIAAPICRCAACHLPLCAVDQFELANQVFCKRDFERAAWSLNTWATDSNNAS